MGNEKQKPRIDASQRTGKFNFVRFSELFFSNFDDDCLRGEESREGK